VGVYRGGIVGATKGGACRWTRGIRLRVTPTRLADWDRMEEGIGIQRGGGSKGNTMGFAYPESSDGSFLRRKGKCSKAVLLEEKKKLLAHRKRVEKTQPQSNWEEDHSLVGKREARLRGF